MYVPFSVSAQDILLMVGPYGDWVKYSLEERAILTTELDGVRPAGRRAPRAAAPRAGRARGRLPSGLHRARCVGSLNPARNPEMSCMMRTRTSSEWASTAPGARQHACMHSDTNMLMRGVHSCIHDDSNSADAGRASRAAA